MIVLWFYPAAKTFPLICNFTGELAAVEYTKTDFRKVPVWAVLYFTVIFPVSPGAMGSLGQAGTVQPQVLLTLFTRIDSLPRFLKTKDHVPSLPTGISP